MRRLIALLSLAVLAVAVAASADAATKNPVFAFGTYRGPTSLHGKVTMRLYEGTCDRDRGNVTPVHGDCFVITTLTPTPPSTCPNSTSQSAASLVTLAPYGSDPEKIHLSANGRYRDVVEQFESGPKPINAVTLTFVAKGRTVNGKVIIHAGGDGTTAPPCTAPVMTFRARLGGK
jgi:hypothetical protein